MAAVGTDQWPPITPGSATLPTLAIDGDMFSLLRCPAGAAFGPGPAGLPARPDRSPAEDRTSYISASEHPGGRRGPRCWPRGTTWTRPVVLAMLLTGCHHAVPPRTVVPRTVVPTPSLATVPSAVPEPSPTGTPKAASLVPRRLLPGAMAEAPAVPAPRPFRGTLLVADRGHARIVEVSGDGTVAWTFPRPDEPAPPTWGAPDDAFFAPDGHTVIANAEESQTVTALDPASGSIRWQVGHFGVRGHGPGYFNGPDDAVPFPDGTIWVADIRNCRLVHLGSDGSWLQTVGNGRCHHAPPLSFASPNGVFPAADGSLLVTEIGGSWITRLSPDLRVRWSVRSPAVYPSDAVPYPDASVLLTDYSTPGAVFRISRSGHVLWRYRPSGDDELDHPSIAIPVAANRVAICDDFHHRIVVVDPTTNTVIWTFGGARAGPLRYPDGLDYRPAAGDVTWPGTNSVSPRPRSGAGVR